MMDLSLPDWKETSDNTFNGTKKDRNQFDIHISDIKETNKLKQINDKEYYSNKHIQMKSNNKSINSTELMNTSRITLNSPLQETIESYNLKKLLSHLHETIKLSSEYINRLSNHLNEKGSMNRNDLKSIISSLNYHGYKFIEEHRIICPFDSTKLNILSKEAKQLYHTYTKHIDILQSFIELIVNLLDMRRNIYSNQIDNMKSHMNTYLLRDIENERFLSSTRILELREQYHQENVQIVSNLENEISKLKNENHILQSEKEVLELSLKESEYLKMNLEEDYLKQIESTSNELKVDYNTKILMIQQNYDNIIQNLKLHHIEVKELLMSDKSHLEMKIQQLQNTIESLNIRLENTSKTNEEELVIQKKNYDSIINDLHQNYATNIAKMKMDHQIVIDRYRENEITLMNKIKETNSNNQIELLESFNLRFEQQAEKYQEDLEKQKIFQEAVHQDELIRLKQVHEKEIARLLRENEKLVKIISRDSSSNYAEAEVQSPSKNNSFRFIPDSLVLDEALNSTLHASQRKDPSYNISSSESKVDSYIQKLQDYLSSS